MPPMHLLSATQVQAALAARSGWRLSEDGRAIYKEFTFRSFAAAMQFFAAAAPAIDALNHHPEWTNVYDRVTVRLTTHDRGGVTALDIRLAMILDDCAGCADG